MAMLGFGRTCNKSPYVLCVPAVWIYSPRALEVRQPSLFALVGQSARMAVLPHSPGGARSFQLLAILLAFFFWLSSSKPAIGCLGSVVP